MVLLNTIIETMQEKKKNGIKCTLYETTLVTSVCERVSIFTCRSYRPGFYVAWVKIKGKSGTD